MGKGMTQKSFFVIVLLIIGALFLSSLSTEESTGAAIRRTIGTTTVPVAPTAPIAIPLLPRVAFTFATPTQIILDFYNRQGSHYIMPYLTNNQNVFRYGSENSPSYNLIFVESASSSVGNIGIGNYIVLSDQTSLTDLTANTRIIQFQKIDSANQILTFNDLAAGLSQFTYQYHPSANFTCTSSYPCTGQLIYSGNTYTFFITSLAYPDASLAIDLNADGIINGTKVNVVANQALSASPPYIYLVDLGQSIYSGAYISIPSQTTISSSISLWNTVRPQTPARIDTDHYALQSVPLLGVPPLPGIPQQILQMTTWYTSP